MNRVKTCMHNKCMGLYANLTKENSYLIKATSHKRSLRRHLASTGRPLIFNFVVGGDGREKMFRFFRSLSSFPAIQSPQAFLTAGQCCPSKKPEDSGYEIGFPGELIT